MTNDQLREEQADLTRKLAQREPIVGYTQNCIAIRARLADIEAQLATPDVTPP